jgi:hypothetical protein
MVQPLNTRNIPADFLTTTHYIFGQISVSNTGLLGVLADINVSQVEVHDASIARIVKPDKIINYASNLWMVKRQIVAVSLSKREYIGSSTLLRGGYSRLLEYPVHITSPIYELQGTLQWSGRFDFTAIITEGTNPFLVLYDVKLHAALFPALTIESPAMVFNRNFIDALAMAK